MAIPRSCPGVVKFLRTPWDRREMLKIVPNYFRFFTRGRCHGVITVIVPFLRSACGVLSRSHRVLVGDRWRVQDALTARSRSAHGVLGVVRACLRRAHCTDRAPNTCTEYKSFDIQTVDCFPSPLDTIHVIITTSSLHIGMVGKQKGTRRRGKKTLASPEPYSPPPSPQQAVEDPSQFTQL